MADCKIEDEKCKVRDTQNGDSKDITMTDEGVQNEELANPQKTEHASVDQAGSNGEGVGNEIQIPVETVDTYEEVNLEQPASSAIEEGSLEPSAITSGPMSDITGDTNGVHIDLSIHSTSAQPSEPSLQTQAEGETKSCLNEMELDQEIGTMVEESDGNETLMELLPESQKEGETINNDVNLTVEGETREEKLSFGSNGLQFHPDTETKEHDLENVVAESELPLENGIKVESSRTATVEELDYSVIKEELPEDEMDDRDGMECNSSNNSFLLGPDATEDEETGTLEEQVAFAKELEIFHKERFLDFRPPKFYQEPLNLLKLWRAVVRLGGYEQVTSCKHWRQIGESFKPPKTCTTVSWTFRCFYEKALLEYEKHKLRCGELPYTDASFPDHLGAGASLGVGLATGSGRQRRDAAARAMQGWHSQRLLGNGEVGDPLIKDKGSSCTVRREKPLKSIGLLKRKMPSVDHSVKVVRVKPSFPQSDAEVIDIGHPADWVKVNVQRTKDCFEVYALVPGLLREEVKVQSDPVGRLVISGQPEQLDNPWGVTSFRKVVCLPSRIDPHQTSAVVTLHGQLFVRVPFDPMDLEISGK